MGSKAGPSAKRGERSESGGGFCITRSSYSVFIIVKYLVRTKYQKLSFAIYMKILIYMVCEGHCSHHCLDLDVCEPHCFYLWQGGINYAWYYTMPTFRLINDYGGTFLHVKWIYIIFFPKTKIHWLVSLLSFKLSKAHRIVLWPYFLSLSYSSCYGCLRLECQLGIVLSISFSLYILNLNL